MPVAPPFQFGLTKQTLCLGWKMPEVRSLERKDVEAIGWPVGEGDPAQVTVFGLADTYGPPTTTHNRFAPADRGVWQRMF